MTSRPKPRRKKAIEPLDWRELAEGPALRGLSEILSTPPEIARERASKRAEIDGGPNMHDSPSGTSHAVPPPTVGGPPTVAMEFDRDQEATLGEFPDAGAVPGFPAPVAAEDAAELESHTSPHYQASVTPTVGITPTVDDKLQGVASPSKSEAVEEPELTASIGTPTVVAQPPEGVTTPEGHSPTVGGSPSQEDHAADKEVLSEPAAGFDASIENTNALAPGTEGVTPSAAAAPSEVETPAEVARPTEGGPPTEAVTHTVGVTPTLGFQASASGAVSQQVSKPNSEQLSAHHYRPTGPPTTVGVTPSARAAGWWVDGDGRRYEAKRVQRVVIAQHSMALGEERVYQTLWHARESDGVQTESKKSRIFSLGYDRIARLVRLNEKSVRVLLPKLITKKILEVVAAEHSATRTGRTYRIFNYEEILERQRAANLTNVVKSGRAVEFVWPEWTVGVTPTVQSLSAPPKTLPGTSRSEPTVEEPPTVGIRHSEPEVKAQSAITVSESDQPKASHVSSRSRTLGASSYPPELAPKIRAILPVFDDDALRTLWGKCTQYAPDCTVEEVEYCFDLKARQILTRGKTVNNPVGIMLWAVPKCFEGAAALHLAYRQQKQAEEELRRKAEADYKQQMEEYRRLAQDPSTNPEDREFYEDVLRKFKDT